MKKLESLEADKKPTWRPEFPGFPKMPSRFFVSLLVLFAMMMSAFAEIGYAENNNALRVGSPHRSFVRKGYKLWA